MSVPATGYMRYQVRLTGSTTKGYYSVTAAVENPDHEVKIIQTEA